MLREAIRELGAALILTLLITIALLATFCGSSATPTSLAASPETATTPATRLTPRPSAPRGISSAEGLGTTSEQRLRFERISVEQGLSQSTVNCILQDSKGFMWFGTQDGLNKYDGYSFTVYTHNPADPNSLSHNDVRAIHEDREGVFWIGTFGGGLERFDRETEQFAHYQNVPTDRHSLSHDDVSAVYEDREGMLWIGTHGGGLNRFDRATEQFTRYQPNPSDPYSLGFGWVESIFEDRSGRLWVGANVGGLDEFDRSTGRFTHYRNNPDDPRSLSSDLLVSAIYQDRWGDLWIGTFEGLNKLDRESASEAGAGSFTRYQHLPSDAHSLSSDTVLSIHEDQSGALWVGTIDGLNRFDRETEQFVSYQNDGNDPDSLSSNAIRSIYKDRSGVLWLGTMGGGLNRVRPTERFVHYQSDPNDPHSLSNSMVFSIYEDPSGVVWIGTLEGLDRFDRANGRWSYFQHHPDDPYSLNDKWVYSIYQDREGVLWIGTLLGGLDEFDRETENFVHRLRDTGVTSICEDREGMLWVGTYGAGLAKFDRETGDWRYFQHDYGDPKSLSDNWIYSMHKDPEGVLWIGTVGGGLNRFDPATEQFTRYQHRPNDPHSLSADFVVAIHTDREGVLWVGTNDGGLNKLDRAQGTFTHYTQKDGLPGDTIGGILEDDHGNLWLSTNEGLSKFDPRAETFRNYDVSDGLQSNAFTAGAYHKSSSGEMFFGGANGFNAFYPDSIEDNPHVPPVVLTVLTQSGEAVDVGKAVENVSQVTFHRPNSSFEFEFAALGYTQPEKNQYAYMLEGFDKDWHYIGTRRFGRYTNLPGGTYTLRMKGSNNDGVWNEEGISLTITIVPPFWETWWFRAIIALALVGTVTGGYRLRVRGVEARSRELESQVEERTYQLEALYRSDEELYRHLDQDQVLQTLVDVAVDVLQADKSAVMVWDQGRERLVMKVARGFSPEAMAQLPFAQWQGVTRHVAASGEPAIVEDATTDPRREGERAEIPRAVDSEALRSFMHLPIKIGGDTFGVFNVSFTETHAFGKDEQRLFVALAQRASLAIENARLYEQAQELAAVEERQRLARDLHDAVTQTLFSTSLIAEVLPRVWEQDPNTGQQRLELVRRGTRSALAEMRTLLLELRPVALAETDLGDLLRQLGEAITGRAGVSVATEVEGECDLPPDVHIALYRIAQEALNNVAKHARANHATVSLHCAPPAPQAAGMPAGQGGQVTLSISDDGRGFDSVKVPPGRFGMGIMRERAEAVGARLEIESQVDHGTRVTVVWR